MALGERRAADLSGSRMNRREKKGRKVPDWSVVPDGSLPL
jgi:hypothetical protein